MTPDSSRYWPLDAYRPGTVPPSFDKQFVRDWLDATGWDRASPPPPLPVEVVARTREKYIQAYERSDRDLVPGALLTTTSRTPRPPTPMLRYLTAGESHGPALTAIVEGFPAGVASTPSSSTSS